MRLMRNDGVFKSWGVGALVLVTLLLSISVAQATCWFESFEALPEGTITNQPGWESLGSGSGLYAASVSSLNAHRGSKALSLANPSPTMSDQRVAYYTNTAHRYLTTNDAIVRLSAWVYRENMKQYLTFTLGTTGTVSLLTVGNTIGGAIYVNGITTSVSWITGRYAKLVVWCNMSNNTVMLDYDGTNVVPWTYLPSTLKRYDNVKIVRSALLSPPTGGIYVDDLAVETISSDTWAWWRFDEQMGLQTEEFTGWFNTCTLSNAPADLWPPPLWDRLLAVSNMYASEKDMYQNQASFAGPQHPAITARHNRPDLLSWTLEILFFFDRNATNNFDFFSMEDPHRPGGSAIKFSWYEKALHAVFRNSESSIGGSYTLFSGAPDDRWHHLAVVKAGLTNLYTFLDYQQIPGYIELREESSGTYYFGPDTTVLFGGFNTGTHWRIDNRILVDEVRFSAKYIMAPQNFLGPGRPIIKSFGEMSTPTQAVLGVAGIPGKVSTIERSTNLTTWVTHVIKTNTHLLSEFEVAMPTNAARGVFLRSK